MAVQDAAGTGNGNPSGATYKTAAEAADALRALRDNADLQPEQDTDPAPVQADAPAREAEADPLPDLNGEDAGQEAEREPDSGGADEADDEFLRDDIDYGELLSGRQDDSDDEGEARSGAELTLQYAGQERRVSGAEAVELAQKGLDYDTKMQAVSDGRRENEQVRSTLDAELQALRKEREDLATRLSAYVDKLEPPNPKLADPDDPLYDPDRYTAEKAKYDAGMAKATLDAAELDKKREQDAEKRREAIGRAMDQHMVRLETRVPQMKNQRERDEVGKYLVKGLGFNAKDLVQERAIHPADSRFLELAYKARRYDLMMVRKKQLKPASDKVADKGKSGRSQGRKSKLEEATARHMKSGSIADAAERLKAMRSS